MDIFYKKDNVVVRRSYPSDADMLCNSLRKSDIDEVWASHNLTPWEALYLSINESMMSLTITLNGKPIGVFGIKEESALGSKAMIWFLATDELDSIRRRFLKHSKKFVNMFLNLYPYLYNYVDSRNLESIKWLEFCGAKIGDPIPYGVMNEPFRYFYFERT
jgi:hypothetical protein